MSGKKIGLILALDGEKEFVQAVSKTVNAEGLSLRGGRRPTWQSREGTCSPYRLPIKRYAPIASVAAVSDRHAGWQ